MAVSTNNHAGATPTPSQTTTINNVAFTVYSLTQDTSTALYYRPNSSLPATAQVSFRKFARSRSYTYSGAPEFTLYSKVMRTNSAGTEEAQYIAVAHCTLPMTATRVLFILAPAADGSIAPLTITAIYDSITAFPRNTLCFYNATGSPLAGNLGSTPLSLNAGASAPISMIDTSGQETPIVLTLKHGDRVITVLHNNWRFYPNNRTLIILLPPKGPDSYRIQAFRLSEYLGDDTAEDTGQSRWG
ncbi:MAG: hypothetical protein SFY80_02545 [Verrucomicrobiota bacterium]|nr:hypothetical protein [Verrucomicrobiota bacterium]